MQEPSLPERRFLILQVILLLSALAVILVMIFAVRESSPEVPVSKLTREEREGQGMIPKVAHFNFWLLNPKEELSDNQAAVMKQWKNAGFEVKLWGPKELEPILKKYPEWKKLYESVPRNIQRADIARLIVVYDQGGFYFDLDCNTTRRSASLLEEKAQQIFFVESHISMIRAKLTAKNQPIRKGIPELTRRIANYSFGAVSGSRVVAAILSLIVQRVQDQVGKKINDYGVLYTTGPDAVTEVVSQYEKDCLILDSHKFMSHTCSGSWRNGKDGKK